MTKASDNPYPSILIQEAATDGSDFSNPDADYRRLFLGEDGQLHTRDSSGTVGSIGGSHTVYGCTVTMSSTAVAQSGVALSFDAEVRDDGSMYSAGTPTRITIQSTGWHMGTGFVTHAADSDGGRRVYWRLNGSTTIGRSSTSSPAAMNDPTVMADFLEYLTASDYVELVADQNSGGNLNLTARASVVKFPFA